MAGKKKNPTAAQTNAEKQDTAVLPNEERVIGKVINCKLLTVRKAPSLKSEVEATITAGTEVQILSATEKFHEVVLANGVTGFCRKQYISI